MARHARNSRLRWAWAAGRWLVCFAVMSLSAVYEAARIADARATVVSGWTAGIIMGAGGGVVLAALVAMTPLVQRQRWSRYGRLKAGLSLIVILATALLLLVAISTSGPLQRHESHSVPYVITSGFEVAESAYIGILSVAFAVGMIAWLVVQVRDHRSPQD